MIVFFKQNQNDKREKKKEKKRKRNDKSNEQTIIKIQLSFNIDQVVFVTDF